VTAEDDDRDHDDGDRQHLDAQGGPLDQMSDHHYDLTAFAGFHWDSSSPRGRFFCWRAVRALLI
jgi:hypothetical protein